MMGLRKALGISCLCICGSWALLDCGGKGDSHPDTSSSAAGESSDGGLASGGGAAATAGTRSNGGAGAAGTGGAAGTAGTAGATSCTMPNADGFTTQWMPPAAMPGACTVEQIAQEYDLCEGGSPKYDRNACRLFDIDPANSACLGCLFSASDADVSGAVIILPGDHWLANVGGCEALLDGDSSATGCGAREQAASMCEDQVCIDACPAKATKDERTACNEAAVTACAKYAIRTSCSRLPRYVACHPSSFEEHFKSFGKLFCGSGPPSPEGGAGGAGGADGASGAPATGGAPP